MRELSTSARLEGLISGHIGQFVDLYYVVNGRTIFARGEIVATDGHILHLVSDTWGDYYLDMRSVNVFTARFCDPADADRLLRTKPGESFETK